MKKPILLIYESIPEETTFYLFKDLNEKEEENLLKCHRNIAGAVGEDEEMSDWLNNFLEGSEMNIVNANEPINLEFAATIVHCGQML